MSKLLFIEKSMNDIIAPSLKNGIEELKSATQNVSSIDVPSGFSYAQEMENLKNSIMSIYKDLQNLESWVADSNRKIGLTETNASDMALLLPQSRLTTRKEVVK